MMNSHPLRIELHDEVHARPRPSISVPHSIAHVSVMHSGQAQACPPALLDFCAAHGVQAPAPGDVRFTAEVGTLRLRWEWHREYHEYTAYVPECDAQQPFIPNEADRVLGELLASETGQVIAALRLGIVAHDASIANEARAEQLFDTDGSIGASGLIGAAIMDNASEIYSDYQLDAAGFGRFLLIGRDTRPPQLGRSVQRIIDIEVGRMMAMLAYPEARDLSQVLREMESTLSGLVARMDIATAAEEPEILQDVIRLAAEVEQMSTYSAYRLDAAQAYCGLVRRGLHDLRECRLGWLQTPTEFLERRFDPAMALCEATNARLKSVSERVARASALLGTRVEIDRERQNQELLAAMNERAELQLRLQQTVEGLSVAAIAYYATGLIGYMFKSAEKVGLPVKYELITGLAVVPIVLAVWFFMHRVRKHIDGPVEQPVHEGVAWFTSPSKTDTGTH